MLTRIYVTPSIRLTHKKEQNQEGISPETLSMLASSLLWSMLGRDHLQASAHQQCKEAAVPAASRDIAGILSQKQVIDRMRLLLMQIGATLVRMRGGETLKCAVHDGLVRVQFMHRQR
jgi:hypothetical protein